MAKRGGVILDICWVHARATHPRYPDLITYAQTELTADVPGATVSENRKVDGTEAVIKMTELAGELSSLPGAVRNAIIRIYNENEHDLVVALVSPESWTGPPPPD